MLVDLHNHIKKRQVRQLVKRCLFNTTDKAIVRTKATQRKESQFQLLIKLQFETF
jgi:hypothetical protein